jgi:prepilin-type N-terminal cleavage/methylation domain-containing protein
MNRKPSRAEGPAFTLIELLVVIAIIALLVAILLPSLGKARAASWKAISLSNVRQITAAAYSYRDDNKQYMPVTLTYMRGTAPSATSGPSSGWCTWQYGGKNCDATWASLYGGKYDVEAADRPLNPYMYPSVDIYAPPAPMTLAAADPNRTTLQLPGYKDPSDRETFQRSTSLFVNPTSTPVSCYDDVGTSYLFNAKWVDQLEGVAGMTDAKAFQIGADRMRLADTFAPSRFVWINDQYSDIIANNVSPQFQLKNGYKDVNKSVMGFLDGHANYLTVRPGGLPPSFSNPDYTFVFDALPTR